MLSDKQKTTLIEKYLLDDLTKKEEEFFNHLRKTDESFAEEVSYHKDFMDSVNIFGNNQLKAHFQKLEANIQADAQKAPTKSNISKVKEQIDYTIDQLIGLFRPVPSYSKVMAYTNRSKGLSAVAPKDGIDCKEGTLYFELAQASSSLVSVQIENNQQTVLLQQTIPAKEAFFSVDLPTNLAPGIYYWKLSNKEDMLMGSFYVGKNRMPEG